MACTRPDIVSVATSRDYMSVMAVCISVNLFVFLFTHFFALIYKYKRYLNSRKIEFQVRIQRVRLSLRFR